MTIPRYVAAVTLVILGMAGLFYEIPYSGWVVFVGLCMAA